MNKAKEAVSGFLHKDGKHDTTVHETVNPAVVNETIKKNKHEETTTAVDREVHQDHYHTSVQPIADHEVLPEQHHHKIAPVKNEEFTHGNNNHVKQRLAAEAAQFKDTHSQGEFRETSAVAPTVVGEHVHHHIHEKIQPVINKETIQSDVIHTTVPIHEVHHNEAKHHTASVLPAVSLNDFKKQGGVLAGREERSDAFIGEPKAVGGTLGGVGAKGTTSLTDPEPRHSHHHGVHGTGSEFTGTGGVGQDINNTGVGSGMTGTGIGSGATGTGVSSNMTGSHTTTPATTTHKSSLMDKLNPKTDSNGDGKAGFMK